jgi:small subunit ribosomal protein S13
MARIIGVEVPPNKRIDIALRLHYGIGLSNAKVILAKAQIDPAIRAKDLTEQQLSQIVHAIQDGKYVIEGDLRREIGMNLKRLQGIKCYRGVRHLRGLPVRGQRTQTNARTRKGPRKTVGVVRNLRPDRHSLIPPATDMADEPKKKSAKEGKAEGKAEGKGKPEGNAEGRRCKAGEGQRPEEGAAEAAAPAAPAEAGKPAEALPSRRWSQPNGCRIAGDDWPARDRQRRVRRTLPVDRQHPGDLLNNTPVEHHRYAGYLIGWSAPAGGFKGSRKSTAAASKWPRMPPVRQCRTACGKSKCE